ncbi:Granulin [Merluccius polli]|uniref:Granulin n=1 Tax=Merluccius polli TaxID=89951 RepID=A0AA47N2E7_MERPO|nr:Granulin [Merluccius polli]
MVGPVLFLLLAVSSATPCPDGRRCEGSDSCCTDSDGASACCPAANAVVCPDQESECPDKTTCCQLPDKSWGCCPMVKAVCCEDKRHCCPEGTQCDLSHSRCVSSVLGYVAMLEKLPARRKPGVTPAKRTATFQMQKFILDVYVASVGVASVTCPGGKTSCPEKTTCCLLNSGDYGCCPYPEAVCCSDHLHCCPANTTCDLEHKKCRSGEEAFLLSTKISARPNDVICHPDSLIMCPDQTTCCQMVNGSYGCCPMPNAMCCSDHLHCCPEGYNCDLVHSVCVSTHIDTSTTSLTPLTSMPAKTSSAVAEVKVNAVPCNDSEACADGNTCCQNPRGQWACCPLPEAVCCKDHLHCCPHGTTCNLVQSRCEDARGHAPSLPWLNKLPVLSINTREEVAVVTSSDEKCDRQTMCPGGTTCCRKGSGHWACCPLPQAVCCNDQEHCCPKGYHCNLAQQSCDGAGYSSVPWVQKPPALPRVELQPLSDPPSPVRVKCDSQTTCPRDTTCCFMKQSGLSETWRFPIHYVGNSREDFQQSSLQALGVLGQGQSTLSKMTPERYPLLPPPPPQAVCCADGEHCCPSGYTCDARTASCSKPHAAGLQRMPWFSKHSAMQQGALEDVKCDNASSCASGTTCCKLATGEWGCCPLVKAVCCDDREHCCPQGYTCNMHSGTCEKKLELLPSRSRLQSKVVWSMLRQSSVEEDIPCDAAGGVRCSKQETCCRTSATEWACCPSPQAVCCTDFQHCCPAGSYCDLAAGGCTPHSQPSRTPKRWDREDLVPLGL